jgi:uncharacterized protein
MPGFLRVHGLEAYGVHSISHAINSAADAAAHALPLVAGPVRWTIAAFSSGIVGLLIGAISIPAIGFAFAPGWKVLKRILWKRRISKLHGSR